MQVLKKILNNDCEMIVIASFTCICMEDKMEDKLGLCSINCHIHAMTGNCSASLRVLAVSGLCDDRKSTLTNLELN